MRKKILLCLSIFALTGCCKHSFGEYVFDNNANCTSNGTETAVCEKCGEATDTREIGGDPKGHVFGEYKYPTSPECGKTLYGYRSCTVCGETNTDDLGVVQHNYSEFVPAGDRTCTNSGTEIATCSICGNVISKFGPEPEGHKCEETRNIESDGSLKSIDYKCKNCSYSYSQNGSLIQSYLEEIKSGLSEGETGFIRYAWSKEKRDYVPVTKNITGKALNEVKRLDYFGNSFNCTQRSEKEYTWFIDKEEWVLTDSFLSFTDYSGRYVESEEYLYDASINKLVGSYKSLSSLSEDGNQSFNERWEWNYDTNDWKGMYRNITERSDDSNVLNEEEYRWSLEKNDWIGSYKRYEKTDPITGNFLREIYEGWSLEFDNWIGKSKYVKQELQNGLNIEDQELSYSWSLEDNDWFLVNSHILTYSTYYFSDSKQNYSYYLVEEETKKYDVENDFWTGTDIKFEYSNFAHGRDVSTKTSFEWNDLREEWVNVEKSNFSYSGSYPDKTEIISVWDPDKTEWINSRKIITTSDVVKYFSDYEIREEYYWSNKYGKWVGETKKRFNAGNYTYSLEEWYWSKKYNTWLSHPRASLSYDDKGNECMTYFEYVGNNSNERCYGFKYTTTELRDNINCADVITFNRFIYERSEEISNGKIVTYFDFLSNEDIAEYYVWSTKTQSFIGLFKTGTSKSGTDVTTKYYYWDTDKSVWVEDYMAKFNNDEFQSYYVWSEKDSKMVKKNGYSVSYSTCDEEDKLIDTTYFYEWSNDETTWIYSRKTIVTFDKNTDRYCSEYYIWSQTENKWVGQYKYVYEKDFYENIIYYEFYNSWVDGSETWGSNRM